MLTQGGGSIMISSQAGWNWKVAPLYWEILKIETFTFLEKYLFALKRHDRKSDKRTDRHEASELITTLARKTDSGDYEVILPFAGKALVDKRTFEQSYRPLEPVEISAAWESSNVALRSVYHKFVSTNTFSQMA